MSPPFNGKDFPLRVPEFFIVMQKCLILQSISLTSTSGSSWNERKRKLPKVRAKLCSTLPSHLRNGGDVVLEDRV